MSTFKLIAVLCCMTQMTKEVLGNLGRKPLPSVLILTSQFRGTDFVVWGKEMCQERIGGQDILGFPFKLQGSEILDALGLGSFIP